MDMTYDWTELKVLSRQRFQVFSLPACAQIHHWGKQQLKSYSDLITLIGICLFYCTQTCFFSPDELSNTIPVLFPMKTGLKSNVSPIVIIFSQKSKVFCWRGATFYWSRRHIFSRSLGYKLQSTAALWVYTRHLPKMELRNKQGGQKGLRKRGVGCVAW